MGKAGGGGAASKASKVQAAQSSELFQLNRPGRGELNSNVLEALSTGGVGPRLPLTQNYIESAGRAGSNALSTNLTELSRNQLAQTPYGLQSQAGIRSVISRDMTNAGTQVGRQMVGMAPSIIQSQAGIGAQQGTAAAQGQAQRAGAINAQNAATTSTIASGAGAAVGIGLAIAIAI